MQVIVKGHFSFNNSKNTKTESQKKVTPRAIKILFFI